MPGLEGVSIRASVREQVLDVPPQPCITSDNAPLSADAVVFFRIRDLALARYAVDDFRACVTNLVLTQLRSEIGQLTLDQAFAAAAAQPKLLGEATPSPRAGASASRASRCAISPVARDRLVDGDADGGRAQEARGDP